MSGALTSSLPFLSLLPLRQNRLSPAPKRYPLPCTISATSNHSSAQILPLRPGSPGPPLPWSDLALQKWEVPHAALCAPAGHPRLHGETVLVIGRKETGVSLG